MQATKAFVAALALAGALRASGLAGEHMPPAVGKAIALYSAQLEGIVVADRLRRDRLKYPGHDGIHEAYSARIRAGSKIVAVKLRRVVNDGKDAPPGELAKEQAIIDKGLPFETGDEWNLRGLLNGTDFRGALPCAECGPGIVFFPFKSAIKDADHGSGTIYVDESSGRIHKLVFTPNSLPKEATSGTTIVVFGNVGAGLWEVTRIENHYAGRRMFITGTFDSIVTLEKYRRAASLEEAHKLLAAE